MQALEDAQVSPADIQSVEVVGGSSRVPALLRIIKDFFGKEPGRTLNAKECVSRGAALNCAMLSPIFRCECIIKRCKPFLHCKFLYVLLHLLHLSWCASRDIELLWCAIWDKQRLLH